MGETDWGKRFYRPLARSMGTLHRISLQPGYRPIETRRYPAWWWPFELAGRLEALAARYLPPELRDGQEPYESDQWL